MIINFKKSQLCAVLLPLMFLGGCNNTTNEIPVVNAGIDQSANANDLVTIAATVTDDDDVTIAWSQISGTTVVINDANNSTMNFIAPTVTTEETLTFQITVSDGTNADVTDTIAVTISAFKPAVLTSWIINNETTSSYISSTSGSVLEDVQSAELESVSENVSDVYYAHVKTQDIPKYNITITQELVDSLNQRPRAATDFKSGSTTAVAGQVVEFGEDIGFVSSTENCTTTGGDGYWPIGPVCPTAQATDAYIPVEPTEKASTDAECETGLGVVGLMVNGTSLFNWGDGMSYGDNVWYTLAPLAEQYDVDICGGHAARGEYHHHFYTSCLADLVGDDGTKHSPIYGYAADGYPLYGPYEAANELAVSGWKVRDYAAPESEGGCNTAGIRSCVLVDAYDITQGVTQVTNGPAIGESVRTLSGNTLIADAGYYFEDYYYAGEPAIGAQLDEHNGHDNNDGRGYHYHITLTKAENGKLSPAFPYTIGPSFKGKLASNSIAQCGGMGGGNPPPPM
jgi:hypothetical protein